MIETIENSRTEFKVKSVDDFLNMWYSTHYKWGEFIWN